MRRLCEAHDIVYMAFSSLGTQWRAKTNPVLKNPVILSIAKKHGRSAAAVVLSWALQEGVVVIPRASTIHHLEDNIKILIDRENNALVEQSGLSTIETTSSPNVFLSSEDIAQIRDLDGTHA